MKLPQIIKVLKTGLDITEGKFYAYHENGQYEITEQEKMEINWFLQVEGHYNLDLADYLNLECEKIEY